MKAYDSDNIRNVALVGHQGSGKTILGEAMLYSAGVINRMGDIQAGNTVSDYHPSEHEREMSVYASLLTAEWGGVKINVLDTPGYPDFIGQAIGVLRGVDTAAIVVNAQSGIEVNTRRVFIEAGKAGRGRMIVINKIDADNLDLPALLSAITGQFGKQCRQILA